MAQKLTRAFYQKDVVEQIAIELLGKTLVTQIDGEICAGKITETEAYNGRIDKACHAFQKRTKRTEIMYGPGGFSYVYLIYGIHKLFNIVTNYSGFADAVLIRAVEPLFGEELMLKRRNLEVIDEKLTSGPGNMAKAMGITNVHNGLDLLGETIWIEQAIPVEERFIVKATRIGVQYAGEDAQLPWRFYDSRSKFVSNRLQ